MALICDGFPQRNKTSGNNREQWNSGDAVCHWLAQTHEEAYGDLHRFRQRYLSMARKTESKWICKVVYLKTSGYSLIIKFPRFGRHPNEGMGHPSSTIFSHTQCWSFKAMPRHNQASCCQSPNEELSKIKPQILAASTNQLVWHSKLIGNLSQ